MRVLRTQNAIAIFEVLALAALVENKPLLTRDNLFPVEVEAFTVQHDRMMAP